jgi:hypothetical protein
MQMYVRNNFTDLKAVLHVYSAPRITFNSPNYITESTSLSLQQASVVCLDAFDGNKMNYDNDIHSRVA